MRAPPAHSKFCACYELLRLLLNGCVHRGYVWRKLALLLLIVNEKLWDAVISPCMKLDNEHRFSIPFAVFEEEGSIPDKAFRLLIFLFMCSDYQGRCRPGYRAMKRGAEIGSDATVKASLALLQKLGWIWTIKKGGSNNSTIAIAIPDRLRKKDVPISVVRARHALKGKYPVLQSVKF